MNKQLVVLLGLDGKQYLGEVESGALEDLNHPVMLFDAWQVFVLDQQVSDRASGRTVGIARDYMLLAIGSAAGALPVLHLRVAGWYDPAHCGVGDNMRHLLEAAKARTVSQKSPSPIVRAGPEALAALGAANPLRDK